jgi:NitT/TauT family transport system ATP-binding protein
MNVLRIHPAVVGIMPALACIEISELTVSFGPLTVIDNMSLTVNEGEFVSLLGPSGCGKSTLLRIIAGLLKPSAGSVRVGGQTLTDESSLRLGMMFQKPLLLPWRTSLANVLLPVELELGGNTVRPMDVERAKRMLSLVQLNDFADTYPHMLSGGMQQRVALARALMSDPEILLLDEPFGALDELTRETLNDELLNIWRSAETRLATVVMVTHSVQEAVAMSDRIFLFGSRPARLREIFDVNIPQPRATDTIECARMQSRIRQLLKSAP